MCLICRLNFVLRCNSNMFNPGFDKTQKTNIIRDYLEDINEIPKSRMFWPREIWSKYVNKLEVYFFSIYCLNLGTIDILLPYLCS
jgi:hypothetical protein